MQLENLSFRKGKAYAGRVPPSLTPARAAPRSASRARPAPTRAPAPHPARPPPPPLAAAPSPPARPPARPAQKGSQPPPRLRPHLPHAHAPLPAVTPYALKPSRPVPQRCGCQLRRALRRQLRVQEQRSAVRHPPSALSICARVLPGRSSLQECWGGARRRGGRAALPVTAWQGREGGRGRWLAMPGYATGRAPPSVPS